MKIKNEIKDSDKNIDEVITNFKPMIFWKEKDVVKKQIEILSLEKIKNLLIKSNDLELSVKKNPALSTNILTNFILEEVAWINN